MAAGAVSLMGTLVLMLILPCAIVLCFVLQCYADFLRRGDAQTLEAFRVQAQERRMQRQEQMQRRGGNNTPDTSGASSTNETNKSRIIKLSEFFVFQMVGKDGGSIIHPKVEGKREKEKTATSTPSTTKEPDGHKREEYDQSDLELCMPPISKTNSTSQSINMFRNRFIFGGRAMNTANKSGIIIASKPSGGPKPTVDEESTCSANTNNNTSRVEEMIRKEDDEDCCCICLDSYSEGDIICTPKKEDCGHVFHKECMFEWIQQNHDCCPLCRVVLVDG